MIRTPRPDRAARQKAMEKIAETFHVGSRQPPNLQPTEQNARPFVHDLATVSLPIIESRPENTVTPAPLRNTRSMFDKQSIQSSLSRSSAAKIEALDRSRQAREIAFFEKQKRQQELDEVELEILEAKRKMVLKRKIEAEEFQKEQDAIIKQMQEIEVTDLTNQEVKLPVPVYEDQKSVISSVHDWLNRAKKTKDKVQHRPALLRQTVSQSNLEIRYPTHRNEQEWKVAVPEPRFEQLAGAKKTMNPEAENYRHRHPILENAKEYNGPWHDIREFKESDSPASQFESESINPKEQLSYRNHQQNSQRDDVLMAALKALEKRNMRDLPIFTGENILDWPMFLEEFRHKAIIEHETTSKGFARESETCRTTAFEQSKPHRESNHNASNELRTNRMGHDKSPLSTQEPTSSARR